MDCARDCLNDPLCNVFAVDKALVWLGLVIDRNLWGFPGTQLIRKIPLGIGRCGNRKIKWRIVIAHGRISGSCRKFVFSIESNVKD